MSEQQARKNIEIRGVITLTAHAHQTSPDGAGEGVTPQMKTGLISGQKLIEVPYITANSVRGMIRRAAGDILMREIQKAGEQISRNLYLSIKRGSYSRVGLNAGGATYPQLVAANDHIFAGLFGGGSYMYPSKLRVERDLFPMLEATKHIFPERYQSFCVNLSPNQLIKRLLIASRDDFARLPEGAFIEDAEEAYIEHMAAKLGANQAKKAQKAEAKAEGQYVSKDEKVKTSDLNTFNQVEAIIAGTPMYFGVAARSVSDAQIGMLLAGIQSWANANALGGGSCRGRGSFKASLSMFSGNDVLIENLFTGDAGSYELSDSASHYSAALAKEIRAGAARAETLNAIFPSVVVMDGTEEEPKGKRGRKPSKDGAQEEEA